MEAEIEKRFEKYQSAPLAWNPDKGGKEAFICFKDSLTTGIGPDENGRFERIAEEMLSGCYYPADAVTFYGRFRDDHRHMKAGDRVLQRAPIFFGHNVWSMVEIYVAEKTDQYCRIGYVTTTKHHGRGIWTATLTREGGELKLLVESVASPNSFLFWIGLPYARFTQLRARRRGIENLASL